MVGHCSHEISFHGVWLPSGWPVNLLGRLDILCRFANSEDIGRQPSLPADLGQGTAICDRIDGRKPLQGLLLTELAVTSRLPRPELFQFSGLAIGGLLVLVGLPALYWVRNINKLIRRRAVLAYFGFWHAALLLQQRDNTRGYDGVAMARYLRGPVAHRRGPV